MRGSRLLAACLLVAGVAEAEGFRLRVGGFVDLRAARTDDTTGWLDGGLGKLRWGGEDGEPKTVLALAQSAVVFRASLGEELRAYAHVNMDTGSYPTSGLAGLDLVEGWVSYRPRLSSSFGLRLRGGHFFPPLSLENDGIAWSPTRTLTASALDSWFGEEVRVTGLETSLEVFLPTSDLTFTGAVFGGNDPCGVSSPGGAGRSATASPGFPTGSRSRLSRPSSPTGSSRRRTPGSRRFARWTGGPAGTPRRRTPCRSASRSGRSSTTTGATRSRSRTGSTPGRPASPE